MWFKRILGILAVIVVMAALVPASQAQSFCYGVLPPRLQVGGQGQVTPGLPNIFRTQPYRGYDSLVLGEIPAQGVFNILGGPSCYEGMYWWQVNFNGQIGWTPEGSNGGAYWTQPVGSSGGCMSLPSRLVAGQNGRVLPGLPNTLRSQPYVGYDSVALRQIPAGSIFNVIAGPNCSGGMSWWMVSYNGQTGWTPEGQYGTYWLEPAQIVVTPPPASCPQYLTPYMLPGYTGIVTPGAPNNLRAQSSLNAAVLASMSSGETFTVLSGPLCSQGINWWQVNYRGVVGWTAEGQNGQAWVEAFNCPGFMPSRISVGKHARVTPGLPNRLRSSASTSASVLTLIPGGATLDVIGGPVCGENAIWWRVNYRGIIGWTMEGQGNTYWMEAAS